LAQVAPAQMALRLTLLETQALQEETLLLDLTLLLLEGEQVLVGPQIVELVVLLF
jgi:hypothetical protein